MSVAPADRATLVRNGVTAFLTGALEPPRLPRHPVAGYLLVAALVLLGLVLTRGWLWP